MELFDLPIEIRLKIYSELLVYHEPISIYGYMDEVTPLLYTDVGPDGIHSAILRTSKQVYSEAISVLYSHNFFRFCKVEASWVPSSPDTIRAFVQQIGARSSLLRHVYTYLPRSPRGRTAFDELDLGNLNHLVDSCPGIITIELAMRLEMKDLPIHDSPSFAGLLGTVEARLNALPSLQQVKVDLKLLSDGSGSDDADSQGGGDSQGEDYGSEAPGHGKRWEAHKDSLMGQLSSRGWTVDITEVWIASDGSKFDNRTALNNYMYDLFENEMEERREQARERQAWADYYQERQEWAYRMDYADDGGPVQGMTGLHRCEAVHLCS